MPESVYGYGSHRIRRFGLYFYDFCFQPENILIEFRHIVTVECVEVSGQQYSLSDSEKVHSLRNILVPDSHEAAGGSSRYIFEFPVQPCLYLFCQFYQLLKFFCRRRDGSVTSQIGADTHKLNVYHPVFYVFSYLNHLFLIPEAFSKISQIGHEYDFVKFSLAPGFFVQRFYHLKLTVEAYVGKSYHVADFAEHRYSYEHLRFFDPCVYGVLYLLESR